MPYKKNPVGTTRQDLIYIRKYLAFSDGIQVPVYNPCRFSRLEHKYVRAFKSL